MTGGLLARIQVRRNRFTLDVDLDLPPGQVMVLIGPNGAGKSTALRALSGLVPLRGGRVELGGRVLDDPVAGRFVPPQQRRIGVVFQEYLLFPHLSVVDNVAFGLRARRVPRKVAIERAVRWLDVVGLADVAGAKPAQISGGQAQRVALARALATDPAMLLLDEPLAALDASTRMRVRSDLRRHVQSYAGCTVLVTHDPLDAMVLADRLVVVEDGRVVQRGAPGDVARAPRTEYVARLVGLNLYRGRASGTTVAVNGGGSLSTSTPATGPVFATFPPAAVSLHPRRPDGSPRNTWHGRITGMEQHAATVRVRVDADVPLLADVTTAAVADLGLSVDTTVWAAVKATEISVYPA